MYQSGIASPFGVVMTLAFTGLLIAENKVVGAQVTDDFNVSYLKDGVGDYLGLAAAGHAEMADFRLLIIDAGGDLSESVDNVVFPAPLSKITIAAAAASPVAGIAGAHPVPAMFLGDWNYIGNSPATLNQEGYAELSLRGWRRVNNDGTRTAFSALTA